MLETPLLLLAPKLPRLPKVVCPKPVGFGLLDIGGCIGDLPFTWCELEPPILGVIIVDERHNEFLAASFYKSIRVAYLLDCQLNIKSARTEPFLSPPMYSYNATFTAMSSFKELYDLLNS